MFSINSQIRWHCRKYQTNRALPEERLVLLDLLRDQEAQMEKDQDTESIWFELSY
jgi:hypothetical protein